MEQLASCAQRFLEGRVRSGDEAVERHRDVERQSHRPFRLAGRAKLIAERLPERRRGFRVHAGAGADHADPVAAGALGPAEVMLEPEQPLRRVADVFAALSSSSQAWQTTVNAVARARRTTVCSNVSHDDDGARSANFA